MSIRLSDQDECFSDLKCSVMIQRSCVRTPVRLNLGCIILLSESDFEPKCLCYIKFPAKANTLCYFILSCFLLFYLILSCLVLSYLALFFILSCLVSSYLVLPLSYLVLFYLILSYFVSSSLILFYSLNQKSASLISSINTMDERSGQQYTISMDLFKSVFEHEGSSFYLRLGTLCK